jgi:F0F1-type ATP synthase assembly protein I
MYDVNNISNILFIAAVWLIIALIPVINFEDYKTAYSANIYAFFFPNFFFYIFLYRYSPNYFSLYFLTLITRTIILGLTIILFSIALSTILNKTIRNKVQIQLENYRKLVLSSKFKCPNCGTEFDSVPKYCYNCLTELQTDDITNE